MPGKVRTQIQLEPRQYELLKELAHERRQSLAMVIRTILDQVLESGEEAEESSVRDARWAFVGKGRDIEGKPDVARRHARYLYGGRG